MTTDYDAAVLAVKYAGLQLPRCPRLAPWLVAVALGDDRLQIRSAESSHTLSHPQLSRIFRQIETLLDGRHTVDDIVGAVGAAAEPATVVFLLKLLHGKGLLQPGRDDADSGDAADASRRFPQQFQFLSHFVADASSLLAALAVARVGLVGAGQLHDFVLAAAPSVGLDHVAKVDESGLRGSHAGSRLASLDLLVACADSPAPGFFDHVNRACIETGTRWLRVTLIGTGAELGPTVVPMQTACYTCFDLRVRTHQGQDLEGYLQYRDHLNARGRPVEEGSLAPFSSIIASHAILEVVRVLTAFAPATTIGRFYEFSAVSPVAIPHDVLRVPRCPACSRCSAPTEPWDLGLASLDAD